jgi:hypothetical protein
MTTLMNLPHDVHFVITGFLDDLTVLKLYSVSNSMRNLVFISMIGRDPIIFQISRVRDMVKWSRHPLIHFSIHSNDIPIPALNMFKDRIEFLNMSKAKISDTSSFEGIRTLDLSNTAVKNVFCLRNCHSLNLSFTNVVNVSDLGGVHTLNLSWTKVSDVSALGRVFDLNLSCTSVTDVSSLTGVKNLNISWCNVKNSHILCGVSITKNTKSRRHFWSV